jgi:hypothetical protein
VSSLSEPEVTYVEVIEVQVRTPDGGLHTPRLDGKPLPPQMRDSEDLREVHKQIVTITRVFTP